MTPKEAVTELIECWEEIARYRLMEYNGCRSLSKAKHEELLKYANDADTRVTELHKLLATIE